MNPEADRPGDLSPSPSPQPVLLDEPPAPKYRWYHKAGAVLFTIVCFELGVFLLVFPWMELWSVNYFASFGAQWRDLWLSPYFRGAVSGLGLVNIFISFVEIVRLRRFSSG